MHTQFDTYWIALDSVDLEDHTFKVSSDRDIEPLSRSIETLGLINPPLVQEKGEGKHRIISGFLRVKASREIGIRRLQVRAVDPLIPDRECAMLAVAENASQRPLELMETSRALSILGPGLSWDDRVPMIVEALFLDETPNQRHMEQVQSLCSMIPEIQAGVEDGSIAFPMALKLHAMDEAEARAFARLFAQLGLSLGKQREILTLVTEIAKRDDFSSIQVLESEHINAVLEDEDSDQNAKARKVRAWLKQWRFPHIEKAREAFEAEVQGLGLPKGVRLEPPPHFEGQVYELKFHFKNVNDLVKNHNVIIDISEKPGLRKILER